MSLRIRRLLIPGLALIGIWQLGAGLYIHVKAQLAQQLIQSAWTRSLDGEREVRPWPWADTSPIARLQVPALDIDLYVLADASGRSLAFGPGYVSGSATPGAAGNTIIAAHRDTHFRFLQHLTPGTRMTLQTYASPLVRAFLPFCLIAALGFYGHDRPVAQRIPVDPLLSLAARDLPL